MFQNKPSAFKPAPSGIEGDDLGPYPTDVDNAPTRQRLLERALRAVTIVAIIEGLVVVALICFLIAIFPLKQVYPYLVTFRDNEEQIVAIEPISTDAPGIQYATEASVRDYVNQRHSFAPVNSRMDAQWGEDSRLATMTGDDEWKDFTTASALERTKLMSTGYSRQIRVESATMIRPDTWQVNFTSFDSLGGYNGTLSRNPAVVTGSKPETQNVMDMDLSTQSNERHWLATMTVEYLPERVTYDQRLLNPLGFTVTDYSVTARK